jgi:hypothetical protein
MRGMQRSLSLLLLLIALPLVALADGNDEQERNRKLLEKARSDPQHYARLLQDLQAFLALPEEKQKELRKLDHDLHDEDSAGYARLQRVLERYNDWLQRLPETERKKLESAADAKEKLRLIKEIREREWIGRLPRTYQEELARLASEPTKYRQRIKELHEEERQRHQEWAYAIRHWNEGERLRQVAGRLQKLKPEIAEFVRDSLTPLLSEEEKLRLKQDFDAAAKPGQWVQALTTLVELSDKHPLRYPPSPKIGPRQFTELPAGLQARLKKAAGWPPPDIDQSEGKWPEYAEKVTRFARDNRILLPAQLGPSHLADFTRPVQEFCKQQLLPVLTEQEKTNLRDGIWPRYANQLANLARKHKLQIPGMTLPGEPFLWQPFRNRARAIAAANDVAMAIAPEPGLPDVPDRMLRDFLQKDLTPEQQAGLPSLSLTDPETRELIKQQFFKRNPDVLDRLQKADQKKQTKKNKLKK